MIEVAAGIKYEELPELAKGMASALAPQVGKRFTVPGIVGAGSGLVAGGAMPVDEDDDDAWLHQLRNAGIGTVLGGLGGLGVGGLRRYGAGPIRYRFNNRNELMDVLQPTESVLSRLLKQPTLYRNLPSPGRAAAAHPSVLQYLLEQGGGPVELSKAIHDTL